jgi:FixJ family two-component response regulator
LRLRPYEHGAVIVLRKESIMARIENLIYTARTRTVSGQQGSSRSSDGLTPVVFVVNDDPSVRESLVSLIRSAGWQAKAFGDARTFLSHPRELAPSCLILDVDLPDIDGLELQALVADRLDLPVMFVTECVDVRTTVRAMKAGAVEFLTRPFDEDILLVAISHAILLSRAALSRQAETRVLHERYASLSDREQEVMERVIAGKLNKLIANDLGISEITVKAHRGRVMRKMAAASVPHLVNMAATLALARAPTLGVDYRSSSSPTTHRGFVGRVECGAALRFDGPNLVRQAAS